MTKVFEAKLSRQRELITQIVTSDEVNVKELERHINIYCHELPFFTEEVLETNDEEQASRILSEEFKFAEIVKAKLDDLKGEKKLSLLGVAKGKKAKRQY